MSAPTSPSAVTDKIVPWLEVRKGDLVLWDGEFRCVEHINPMDSGNDAFVLDGETHNGTVPAGDYAAVRRYTEGPSGAMAIRAARLLLTRRGVLPEVHTAFGEPLRPLCGNPEGFGPGGHAALTLEITCQGCMDRHGFTEDQLAEYDRWTREGIPPEVLEQSWSREEVLAYMTGER
jgi:hypothetical protein